MQISHHCMAKSIANFEVQIGSNSLQKRPSIADFKVPDDHILEN